jgi:hypothetical protein
MDEIIEMVNPAVTSLLTSHPERLVDKHIYFILSTDQSQDIFE